MRLVATLVGAFLLLAGSAVAAMDAAKDPSTMILRQSDLGTPQYERGDDLDDYLRRPLKASGLSGFVATYVGASFSKQKGFLQISGTVLTVERAADARKVFAITTKARDSLLRRSSGGWTNVSLPAFGGQQRALVDPPGNEGIAHAELLVRKNTTVWLLYLTLERRPKPPVSELIADLKRYAGKQKLRVGAG